MAAPERFGRYEVLRELGRGGMAVVYLARDPQVGRLVAVKVMSAALASDSEFRRRFAREAQALARLEHAAIVPLYDHGEHEGSPYLVFRFMEGGSLADRIDTQGPLPVGEVATVARRIGAAIDYAHAFGIVHRDIKPANILFDSNGDAWLSDFGIAAAVEQTSSLTRGGVIGSPAYVSPEQANGLAATGASDIYSLGCALFEALTGRPPFVAETPVALLLKHIQSPAPNASLQRPDIPATVASALARAMAEGPSDRWRTGREFANAVAMAATRFVGPTRALPRDSGHPGPGPDRPRRRRHRTGLVLFAVALAVLLCGSSALAVSLVAGNNRKLPTAAESATPPLIATGQSATRVPSPTPIEVPPSPSTSAQGRAATTPVVLAGERMLTQTGQVLVLEPGETESGPTGYGEPAPYCCACGARRFTWALLEPTGAKPGALEVTGFRGAEWTISTENEGSGEVSLCTAWAFRNRTGTRLVVDVRLAVVVDQDAIQTR